MSAMQERQEAQVSSLGGEDPLEEEMATHCSILAWGILWTERLGGLQSMEGVLRVGHNLATKPLLPPFYIRVDISRR